MRSQFVTRKISNTSGGLPHDAVSSRTNMYSMTNTSFELVLSRECMELVRT